MNDFDVLINKLDSIIADDSPLVTVEMITMMRKSREAIQKLKPQIERANRAGIKLDDSISRLANMENKIDTFLREYDR